MDLLSDYIPLKREAIELLYCGTCNIYEITHKRDLKTNVTRSNGYELKYSEIPCRLSSQSSGTTNQTETADEFSKSITLILAPEIEIKAGSHIEVTQYGNTDTYVYSGEKRLYSDHQTISLLMKEDKA